MKNAVEFLTSPKRGLRQLNQEQAEAEILFLTEKEKEILMQYYDKELRGDDLRGLYLFEYQYWSYRVSPSDEEVELIRFLTSDERLDKKLSPKQALAEMNGLYKGQLTLLMKCYDSGLRGADLRKCEYHHPDKNDILSFFELQSDVLSFLTAQERGHDRLTFEQALAEIESLDPKGMSLLIQHYDEGLRREHFCSAKPTKTNPFNIHFSTSLHGKTLEFLTSPQRGDKKLSVQDALLEIKGLTNKALELLHQFYDLGLRAETLHKYQHKKFWMESHFLDNLVKLLLILTQDEKASKGLSFEQIFDDIENLDEAGIGSFIKYYSQGLTASYLNGRWMFHPSIDKAPPIEEVCSQENQISILRRQYDKIMLNKQALSGWPKLFLIDAISFLMNEERGKNQLSFEEALSEIQGLNEAKVTVLTMYYDQGLRAADLKALSLSECSRQQLRELYIDDIDFITFLTSDDRGEKKCSPQKAIAEINHLNENQMCILCHFYDRGLRGGMLYDIDFQGEIPDHHFKAYTFFIEGEGQRYGLSFEDVFAEVKNLNEREVNTLIKYYEAGLRGEEIRAWKHLASEFRKELSALALELIFELTSEKLGDRKLFYREVIIELIDFKDEQLACTKKFYDLGLPLHMFERLNWYDVNINQFQRQAIPVLQSKGCSVYTALTEIKNLNQQEIEVLIKYYDEGLRGNHFNGYGTDDSRFSSAHVKAVDFFTSDELAKRKLSPKLAIRILNALAVEDIDSFCNSYVTMSFSKICDFIQENRYKQFKLSFLSFLIHEQQYSIEQAIEEIEFLNETESKVLIANYGQGLRGRDLRWRDLRGEKINSKFLESVSNHKEQIDQLQMTVLPEITKLSAEMLYCILIIVQNPVFLNDVISKCSLDQLQTLIQIASSRKSPLMFSIIDRLFDQDQEALFLRHGTHSLNSFLKVLINSTEENQFFISKLEDLEQKQQSIVETNRKKALFGMVLPYISFSLPEQVGLQFADLIEAITTKLPEHLKPAVQAVKQAWDASSTPVTKDAELLNLFQALLEAITRYQLANPENQKYAHWEEELHSLAIECKEGKITAFNNLIMSLQLPISGYIYNLLMTQAESILDNQLGVHPGIHVHYPQAVVCAFLGIQPALQHQDPFAFNLSMHRLKTIASQVACALDRASFINASTPDISQYFIDHIGKEVNVNSMEYRNALRDFIEVLKQYGLSSQLGLLDEDHEILIASYLLGGIKNPAEFEAQFNEGWEQELMIQIRPDLREQLRKQAEYLLCSQGLLMPEEEWNALKSRVKDLLLGHITDDSLLVDLLTKLNGTALLMEVICQMSEEEFNDLKIDVFSYRPSGLRTNLLELLSSNPLISEDIFASKLIVRKSGPIADPRMEIGCLPYEEAALETPIRTLFHRFNKEFPSEMQCFYETFYTQPGSLHFAILQLNSNGENRETITEILMQYLGYNDVVIRETDNLMELIATFFIDIEQQRFPVQHLLMKTFVEERLQFLLEYNLLIPYFRTLSMMPEQIRKEAFCHQADFFTPERVTFIRQNQASLKPYLDKFDPEFHEALAAAQRSVSLPLQQFSLFAPNSNAPESSLPEDPSAAP